MEHTKGKWKLDKSGVATAIKSGDVFVASIYNRDKRIKGDGITEVWGNDAYDTSETDANANLMVLAPELLEEIKDVKTWILDFRNSVSKENAIKISNRSIRITDLIAKAEGE